MYTGPNLTNDNLVFGYDTGYGVANTAVPTRFYQGKPTVNMLTSGDNFGNWNKTQNSGNPPTITSGVAPGPFVGTLADRMSIPTGGSYPRIWQNYTPASTDTHTFSVWLKAESSGQGVFVGAFRNSPWSLPSSTSFTITDEWVNYSFAINPQDTTSMQLYIGSHDSHKGKEFLIYGAQLQTGSDKSPFVDGTRSSTNSLIDLTKSTDLTLSAMTYDSTGQPDYDGTNDYINLGDYAPIRLGNNFTIECVVRPEQDKWMYFFHKGYGSNNSLAWGRHSSSDNWFFSTMINGAYQNNYMGTATLNKYCHLVATYDGANLRLYENGDLKVTSAKTHDMLTSSASAGIGGPDRYWNGKIPVTKIYSKVLTTEEVVSNFKAYKNRFNI